MAKKTGEPGEQTIEKLTERYQELNKRKIQAETTLKNAQKQLEELRKAAREEYGTDDLAELKKKLEEMKRENEARRSRYQQDLDKIEADLARLDAQTAADGDGDRSPGRA